LPLKIAVVKWLCFVEIKAVLLSKYISIWDDEACSTAEIHPTV
jgi:hypothetical protein